MFGRNKENGEEKVSILTRLKNFFTGKKESTPEVFEMNDLEPDPAETANQPDIATYSRYTEEYQEFLTAQEQQATERTVPADMTEETEETLSETAEADPETDSQPETTGEE